MRTWGPDRRLYTKVELINNNLHGQLDYSRVSMNAIGNDLHDGIARGRRSHAAPAIGAR